MSYSRKTWEDRQTEFPTRRKVTYPDSSQEVITVERYEGATIAIGDAFTASNMNDLEERIEAGLGEKVDLSNIIAGIIDQSSLNSFYTAVAEIFADMNNNSMRCYDFRPGWSGNLFGGVRQPIWLYRRQSGAYLIFCPYNCTTGYYYSSSWHWTQASMTSITSPT